MNFELWQIYTFKKCFFPLIIAIWSWTRIPRNPPMTHGPRTIKMKWVRPPHPLPFSFLPAICGFQDRMFPHSRSLAIQLDFHASAWRETKCKIAFTASTILQQQKAGWDLGTRIVFSVAVWRDELTCTWWKQNYMYTFNNQSPYMDTVAQGSTMD